MPGGRLGRPRREGFGGSATDHPQQSKWYDAPGGRLNTFHPHLEFRARVVVEWRAAFTFLVVPAVRPNPQALERSRRSFWAAREYR